VTKPKKPAAEKPANVVKLAVVPKAEPEPEKRKGGRRKWQPTPLERRTIERCAAIGLTQEQIGAVIGKSVDAIFKYCRAELEHGAAKVHARVGGKLYQKCMKGDTVALIFWAKTRLGWNERQLVEHSGRGGGPIVFDNVQADAEAFTQRIAAMGQRMAAKPPEPEAAPLDPRTIN
jgi:hypothetical protein